MTLDSQPLELYSNAQVQIESLGLIPPGGSQPVPVEFKKIIQWNPEIELPNLPIIFAVGSDTPESAVPWGSENWILAKYMLYIALIAGSNRDSSANADVWMNWGEQIRRLNQWGMQAQLLSCFMSEYVADPPFLKKDIFIKGYDYVGFGMRLWNVEPRTNPGG